MVKTEDWRKEEMSSARQNVPSSYSSPNGHSGDRSPEFGAIIHNVVPWGELELGVENVPGEVRHPGRQWSRKLKSCYGHVRGYMGHDGKALDFYGHPSLLDPDRRADLPRNMHLISQINPESKQFDEHKLMLGWAKPEDALNAYLQEMPDGYFGAINPVTIGDLDPYSVKTYSAGDEPQANGQSVGATGEAELGEDPELEEDPDLDESLDYENPYRDAEGRYSSGSGGGSKSSKAKGGSAGAKKPAPASKDLPAGLSYESSDFGHSHEYSSKLKSGRELKFDMGRSGSGPESISLRLGKDTWSDLTSAEKAETIKRGKQALAHRAANGVEGQTLVAYPNSDVAYSKLKGKDKVAEAVELASAYEKMGFSRPHTPAGLDKTSSTQYVKFENGKPVPDIKQLRINEQTDRSDDSFESRNQAWEQTKSGQGSPYSGFRFDTSEPPSAELEEDAELEEFLALDYAIPEKYADLDFVPPKTVQDNARQALEARAKKPPSGRGGTPVGLARARDLALGKQLSPETVRRMLSYFQRHEVDKKGEGWDDWSKGRQAWGLWGGSTADQGTDPAWKWVEGLVENMNKIDEAEAETANAAEPIEPETTGDQTQPGEFAEDGDGKGMMIGMWLPAEISQALAIPGFESASDLHLTLSYHGKFPLLPAGFKTLLTGLQSWAKNQPPLPIKIGGYGVFLPSPGSDNMQVLYASVDCPGLIELRNELTNLCRTLGFPVDTSHGFNAHITLAYLPPGVSLVPTIPDNLNFSLDRVTLAFGGRQEHVALGTGEILSASAYGEEPEAKYAPPAPAIELVRLFRDSYETAGETPEFLSPESAQDYLIAMYRGEGLSQTQVEDLYRWFEEQGRLGEASITLSEWRERMAHGGDEAYNWAKALSQEFSSAKEKAKKADPAPDEPKDAPATTVKVGSEVMWRFGKGKGSGKIVKIMPRPTDMKLQGVPITRNGSPENPAVLIKQPSGSEVLKLLSELMTEADDDALGYEMSEPDEEQVEGTAATPETVPPDLQQARAVLERLNRANSLEELQLEPLELQELLRLIPPDSLPLGDRANSLAVN